MSFDERQLDEIDSVPKMMQLYRTVLDQLPPRGFYVIFLQDGFNMILPMKAVDTREEANAVPEQENHVKLILDGTKPFRLWQLMFNMVPIRLIEEYDSKSRLELAASNWKMNVYKSGPGIENDLRLVGGKKRKGSTA